MWELSTYFDEKSTVLSDKIEIATAGNVALAHREIESLSCEHAQPDEEVSPERSHMRDSTRQHAKPKTLHFDLFSPDDVVNVETQTYGEKATSQDGLLY